MRLPVIALLVVVAYASHHHHGKAANDEPATEAPAPSTAEPADDEFYAAHPGDCPKGYWFAHGRCQDIDECAPPHPAYCPPSTVCKNLAGSFTCDCGPRMDFVNGVCVDTELDNLRNNVCFLEFPRQFLDYSPHGGESAKFINGHLNYNPGFIPKGNAGVTACRSLCAANSLCDAAVVQEDKEDGDDNKCFLRKIRTDDEKAPANEFLQHLRQEDGAVTFVKAPCGASCEYPGIKAVGQKIGGYTAGSRADCGMLASGVPTATVAVYFHKEDAAVPEKNCLLYAKHPKPDPHADDYHHFYMDDKKAVTLTSGPCVNAFKFYQKLDDGCCLTYKRRLFMKSSEGTDTQDPLLGSDGAPLKAVRYPIETARIDCCRRCRRTQGCTSAQLVEGRCTLLQNNFEGVETKKLEEQFKNFDVPEEQFYDEYFNSNDDVDVIVLTSAPCNEAYCVVYDVRGRSGEQIGKTINLNDKSVADENRLAACWKLCRQEPQCNGAEVDGRKCTLYETSLHLGYTQRDAYFFGYLFLTKPNLDGVCRGPIDPE